MKKIFCIIMTSLMILSAIPSRVGTVKASSANGNWYSFGGVKNIEYLNDEMKVSTSAANKTTVISVSFPTEGGVRVHNEAEGFFKPTSLNKIEYIRNSSSVIMNVNGQKMAALNFTSSDWRMDFFDKNGIIATSFGSKDLFVEYSGSEYSKSKIEGTISDGEVFTGLGERYSGLILNGKTYSLWNEDCWSKGNASYVNVPFFHSNKGYSLFYNSSYGATADIGGSNNKKYSLSFDGPDLDFYVWTDTPLENIKSYTSLTGKPFTAPKWAFGYWAGGTGSYWSSENQNGKTELDLVKKVIEGYKALGTMPVALYGEASPSYNKDVYNYLKTNNVYMLGWNHPGATWKIEEFNVNIVRNLCPGIADSLLPIIRKKSDPSQFYEFSGRPWVWGDYSNPNSVLMTTNKMRTYWIWGVRGAMVDYGEYVDKDTVFYNGMYGDEMHNFYPYYYNQSLNEAWSNRLDDDFILFARAGCAGSQKYAASFGGDQESTFVGLKQAIMGGISISSSGFSVWGSDIGGLGSIPTEELYNRWLEFATFSPLMRAHGNNRNPFYYGSEATNKNFQKYYWLRENLIDTIYSANVASGKYGTPMMQSMQIAFPENSKLYNVEDQYMFCNDLLVCPVYEQGAVSRDIVFPEGLWYDLFSGEKVLGGVTKTVKSAVDEIPVFIASGSVLPITIANSLELCEDNSKNSRSALLITPPTSNKETEIFSDQNTAIKYSVTPVSANSFDIKSTENNEADLLVIYDSLISKIVCDGVELTLLDSKPTDDGESGYYVDSANGKTYVSLANSDWNTITVKTNALEIFEEQIYIPTGKTVEEVYKDKFSFSYNHETRYENNINPDACFKSLAGTFLERKQYAAINEPWFAGEYFSRTAAISPKDKSGNPMLVNNFSLSFSFRVGVTTSNPHGAVLVGIRQKEAGHFFDGYSHFNQNQSFLRLTNTGITISGGSAVPRGGNPVNASKEDISFLIASKAGDLNNNGRIDIVDFVKFKKKLLSLAEYSESVDLNGDSKFNAEDVVSFKKRLLEVEDIGALKELMTTVDSYVTVNLKVVDDYCTVTLSDGRNESNILFTYRTMLEPDAPKYGYLSIGIGDTFNYSIKNISVCVLQ